MANIEGITLSDNVYRKDLFVDMQIVSGSAENESAEHCHSALRNALENKQILLSQLLENVKKKKKKNLLALTHVCILYQVYRKFIFSYFNADHIIFNHYDDRDAHTYSSLVFFPKRDFSRSAFSFV